MKTVTLKFTDGDARYALYALRKRYGRDKRTNLSKLCEMAIRTEVAALARQDLADAEKAYDEEYEANAQQGGEE